MQKGFTVVFILVGVLVIFLIAGGAYYFGTQNEPVTKQDTTPSISNNQTTNPSASPSNIPTSTNWESYVNAKYGFELQHPINSTVEESTPGGVYPYQYIRIQNYTDKEVNENQGRLVAGQYYLEISIYDHKLGHKSSETCPENMANPKKVDLGAGVTAYRGNGLGGGDSAPYIYAICANKPEVDYYIQASENFETVASKIIDSIKFTK